MQHKRCASAHVFARFSVKRETRMLADGAENGTAAGREMRTVRSGSALPVENVHTSAWLHTNQVRSYEPTNYPFFFFFFLCPFFTNQLNALFSLLPQRPPAACEARQKRHVRVITRRLRRARR